MINYKFIIAAGFHLVNSFITSFLKNFYERIWQILYANPFYKNPFCTRSHGTATKLLFPSLFSKNFLIIEVYSSDIGIVWFRRNPICTYFCPLAISSSVAWRMSTVNFSIFEKSRNSKINIGSRMVRNGAYRFTRMDWSQSAIVLSLK